MSGRRERHKVEAPPVAPARTLGASSRATAVVIAILAVLAGAVHIVYLRFLYDDAFISFRYADNLARGLGLVYNPGERVEGYSNFLWTLLMSLVGRLGARPEDVCHAFTAAFALASLAAVMAAARRRGLAPAVPGFLLAASTCWAAWGTGGLETSLFGLFLTGGALALSIGVGGGPPTAPRRGPASPALFLGSALLFGLACLTRPDGPLAAACAAALVGVLVLRRRISFAAALAWMGVLAVVAAPHLLWKLTYYGQLFPNTFAVKAAGIGRFDLGWRYLAGAFMDLHLYLVVPFALLGLLLPARGAGLSGTDRAAIAAVTIPFSVYLASTGGDFMPAYRFVAPLLPLVMLAAAHGLAALAQRLPAAARRGGPVVAAAVVIAFAGLNARYSHHQQSIWNQGELVSVGWARQEIDDWLRIGDLLRRVALPTDTLATTAAGAAPYRSRLYTLDMLGLNAPDLTHYRRLASDRPGHQLLLEERWVAEHPPQLLLAHPLVHGTPAHLGLSYDMRPEYRDGVLQHYQLVGMTLIGKPMRFVGCALRNDVADRILAAGRALQPPPADP